MKALTAFLFGFMILAVCVPKETMPMDLTRFQWENRLLFVFAPDRNNPDFKNLQNDLMAQKPEVEDRDLVIFEVPERGPARMNTESIDRQVADSIRDHFAVPLNTFSIILVGKDGGIKMKRHDPVTSKEIFDLIDSMPMRKNEMRQKPK